MENFDKKKRGKFHKGSHSPILNIPGVDMIRDFVVADPLHLLELGITKWCLVGWRDGSFGFVGKLSYHDIDKLSSALVCNKLSIEIHRSMRTLDCVAF